MAKEASKPIIQFADAIMYADEGECLSVDVMRIGDCSSSSVVNWKVDFKSEAVARKKCESLGGTVTLEPGESKTSFELRLKTWKAFSSVVEIALKLEEVTNCDVGLYLGRCRVKMIDDDCFPSPKHEKDIRQDPACKKLREDAMDMAMLIEVIKLAFSINPAGSTWFLLGDQVNNLIFIGQLHIGKVLVNALSGKSQQWAANPEGVALLAVLLTLPYMFSHAFAYRKQFWKVGGSVRKEFLTNLMIRSLYYRESTRDQVHITELRETFCHHVFKVVGDGYMKFFQIFASFGRVVMIFCYFLVNAAVHLYETDEPHQFIFLVVFAAIPAALFVYFRMRTKVTAEVRTKTADAQIELANFMDSVCSHYRVLADCWARPQVLDSCTDRVNTVNKLLVQQGARQANDLAFFGWTSEIVEGLVILVGGNFVLSDLMSLGAFTATMAGLRGVTGQFATIYKAVLTMQTTYPAVWLLVQYLNMPMDLEDRMALERKNHAFQTKDDDTTGKLSDSTDFVDNMKIQVKDVTFQYPVSIPSKLLRAEGKVMSQDTLKQVSLDIEQGTLVGITGLPGQGKGTLLRVMAEVLLPSSGAVFMPSHLRVLHVELQDTLPGNFTVLHNVFLALMAARGCLEPNELPREDLERGVRVCEEIGLIDKQDAVKECPVKAALGESLRKVGTPEDQLASRSEGEALQSLSRSRRIKVQIARALVANPEVLIIHLPADSLEDAEAEHVMEVLGTFVRDRGVCFAEDEDKSRRRPRTCIFTSNHKKVLEHADKVFSVQRGVLSEGIADGAAMSLRDAAQLKHSGSDTVEIVEVDASTVAQPSPPLPGTLTAG